MTDEWKQLTQYQVEGLNAEVGTLQDGFDCEICKNKGRIFVADNDGHIHAKECRCMGRRNAVRAVKRSGAEDLLKIYRFDLYDHDEGWQNVIYEKAINFAEQDSGWWFIGGQNGSGKSKISISIFNRLLERGKECRYYLWRPIVTKLNQLIFDDADEYDRILQEIISIPCLYIDDFLTEDEQRKLTKFDFNLAFEIINARYIQSLGGRQTITMLSSQNDMNWLISKDEAMACRICELAGDNVINVPYEAKYNYRMRKAMAKIKKNTV